MTFCAHHFVDNFFLVLYASLHYKFAQLELLRLEPVHFFAYISFLLFCLLYLVASHLLFELINTFCLLAFFVGYAYYLKLEQLWTHLHHRKVGYFSELRLRLHLQYSGACLPFLADFNREYGRAMWAVILVVYPQNAVTWITLFTAHRRPLSLSTTGDRLSPLITFFFILTGLVSVAFVGVVHYKAIYLTARLGNCGRYMASVVVHSKGIRQLRLKLKMERYISLFHSKSRPHTVTYGRYGNVTAQTFGKVNN